MSALHRNSAYLGWTQGPGTRSRRVPDVDSNCRLLIVPPFPGSSRFESLILSHHSRTKLHVSVINEVKAERSAPPAMHLGSTLMLACDMMRPNCRVGGGPDGECGLAHFSVQTFEIESIVMGNGNLQVRFDPPRTSTTFSETAFACPEQTKRFEI